MATFPRTSAIILIGSSIQTANIKDQNETLKGLLISKF